MDDNSLVLLLMMLTIPFIFFCLAGHYRQNYLGHLKRDFKTPDELFDFCGKIVLLFGYVFVMNHVLANYDEKQAKIKKQEHQTRMGKDKVMKQLLEQELNLKQ